MVTTKELISLQDITEKSVPELITVIAGEGLPGSKAPRETTAHASANSVAQLLERFERCDKELGRLQHQVDLRAERLRREAGREEAAYRSQVAGLQAQWAAAQAAFAELETRMNNVTQAATKIGNRLQNASTYRRRAREAADAINRLQEFAHARDPSDLPPLFSDDARLSEAAAVTSKLLAVCQELMSTRERVALAGAQPRPNAAPERGTLENAAEQLELHRNLLDNRLVSRFDAALARQDLATMADCARIMAQLSRGEAVLIQRYISTRPMFTNLREQHFAAQQQQLHAAAAAGGGAGEAAAAADVAALRALSSFYKGIVAAMRDEAVVIEQVFPSPQRALAQYMQRVFEQTVQTAVAAVLAPPPPGAAAAALRAHLRQLAEVYRKTMALADDLQGLCGGGGGGGGAPAVRELAEGVCADALASYLPLELRWLRSMHDARLAAQKASAGGLSMEELLGMLSANEEAVSRCALLSPPAQLAVSVRCLFHSPAGQTAHTGCLLEQVAAHLLLGFSQTMDACIKAAQGPFRPQHLLQQEAVAAEASRAAVRAAGSKGGGSPGAAVSRHQPPPQQPQQQVAAGGGHGGGGSGANSVPASMLSRSDLRRAGELAVAGHLGLVLQAVSTLGAIVSLLQHHYQRIVAPHLGGSGGEAAACLAGIAALARAVEERVAAALQRGLALLLAQAGAGLAAEQQPGDFCPPDAAAPPSLDAPTAACLAACALLGAAVDAAEQHLHGPNLAAFLAELGRQLGHALEAHMQRFVFSPLGALRWKRDLAEYAALVGLLRAPKARQHLEEMQAHVSMLVVPPESLPALVDSNLRISHKAALAVIQLRQDFRTAKVGEAGAGLAALFASE